MNISKYIDHTNLKADATKEDIERLCSEAKEYGFASVCVNSCWTGYAKSLLKGTDVNVCTVVGFPLGAMDTQAKAFEATSAVINGADEIDMVINVGYLKSGLYEDAESDIRSVKRACKGKLLKVILETCLLTREEIVKACEISESAGADYVKTSTGFSKGGAKIEDVRLMRKSVGDRLGVKASGGIHDYAFALSLIEAGASRLGSSSGVAIVSGSKDDDAH